MKKPARRLAAAALVAATAIAAPAVAAEAPWLHVRVTEIGEKATRVAVNLPLAAARVALRIAAREHARKAVEQALDRHDVSLDELREMWREVLAAGDAELVTVDEPDETVRIAREGDRLRIHVEKKGETQETERVRVEVPVAVVDALLSGQGEELDIDAAMDVLAERRGELVHVVDGESEVRVWIDERRGDEQ